MQKPKQAVYIIARDGIDDGVSIMKDAYLPMINDHGIKVNLFYGKTSREHENDGNERFCIPELSFDHPETKWLYDNSFNGVDPDKYRQRFLAHTKTIEDKLRGPCESVDGPTICHNVMALKHYHPALAQAMYNLTRDIQKKNFVNLGPDPSHERPGHLARQNLVSKEALSRTGRLEKGFEGPYVADNLIHLLLNDTQRQTHIRYGVDARSIHVIPDFQRPEKTHADADDTFMEYLSRHCIDGMNGRPRYKSVSTEKDSLYFMCNVRPIERKKLRYAQVVAANLKRYTGKRVFFVVTHGYDDDPGYFKETVEFAQRLGLDYIYLPDLNGSYQRFLAQMSQLRSIAFISSGAGAWENAINEAILKKIPVYVNSSLNSYPHLKRMGMKMLTDDQSKVYTLIAKNRPEDLDHVPMLDGLVQGIDSLMDDRIVRRAVTAHNQMTAERYLSSECHHIRDSVKDMLHHASG